VIAGGLKLMTVTAAERLPPRYLAKLLELGQSAYPQAQDGTLCRQESYLISRLLAVTQCLGSRL
jgi:hypothetical protein